MKPEQEVESTFQLLKAHLKSKKISYADLGRSLKMSESNMKRIFSNQTCSLDMLSKICAASGITMFDLISTASHVEVLSFQLSEEAEAYFLNNFEAFIFFRNLGAALNTNEFLRTQPLSKEKQTSVLESLQKLKLIRKTKGGYELAVSGYMDLSKTPALVKKLYDQWVPWFFEQVLNNPKSDRYSLKVTSTGLSKAHKLQLLAEVEQLFDKYREIGYRDQRIASSDYESVGICIGIGPHRVGGFENRDKSLPFKKQK